MNMRRITIDANRVGLVYKHGRIERVLQSGKHWLGFGERVDINNMSQHYIPVVELDIALQNSDFAALIHIIDVKDNELVLVYQNGNFKSVLTAGRHAIWKGLADYKFVQADTSNIEIEAAIDRNLLEKQPLLNYIRSYKVESFEKGLLFIDGNFERILEAGTYMYWKNSRTIQVFKGDLRQLNMEITGQEILTKDKAQLRLNFSIQYRLTDITRALLENKDFEKQLYITIQLALRECVGLLTFDELMESKEKIAAQIMELSAAKVEALGVQLTNCGVKDIILPGDVKEIMNQVLVAEKRAQANIITRREETASTRSLLTLRN